MMAGACGIEQKTSNQKPPEHPYAISITAASKDGIFGKEQLIQVYATIINRTAVKVEGTVVWNIETDEQMELKETNLPVTISASKTKQTYCPIYEPPGPGFYRISCTLKLDSKGESISDSMIVGYAPERVNPAVTRQPDFDEFWHKTLQELKSIKPQYNLILQSEKNNAKRNLYLVEMKSLGNLTVRGWLEVPKKQGSYPALLRVPGYMSSMKPVNKYNDMVILSFNPRSHGNSDEAPGAPLDLWVRGLDNKEEYYYRGAYMDCIRAVDFLASRPQVDPERIAVWGGSQGGGLSFVTAALDDRISFCIADVPFLCSWLKYFKTTHWDEVDEWLAADTSRNWTTMLQTLSYFDTMNMTDKIKCPVLMGVGLQDDVCPPATNFASFNNIRSKKEYKVYPDCGHNLGPKHWEFGYEWIRNHFGLE